MIHKTNRSVSQSDRRARKKRKAEPLGRHYSLEELGEIYGADAIEEALQAATRYGARLPEAYAFTCLVGRYGKPGAVQRALPEPKAEEPTIREWSGEADPRAAEVWGRVLAEMERMVTRPNFETWLESTAGLRLQEGELVVGVQSAYAASWIESRMSAPIQRAVEKTTGAPLSVSFRRVDAA